MTLLASRILTALISLSYTLPSLQAADACSTVPAPGEAVYFIPAENIQPELQYFSVVFNDTLEVGIADPDALPSLQMETEPGQWAEVEAISDIRTSGNVLALACATYADTPGLYRLLIPGALYTLDRSRPGTDLEAYYEVFNNGRGFTALPEEGPVDGIKDIRLTFGSNIAVEWGPDMTSALAPYVEWQGQRAATFSNLTSQANILDLGLYGQLEMEGEYAVVIPENSYSINGGFGNEIRLLYTVGPGLLPYSVSPAESIIEELQFVQVVFSNASSVTLADIPSMSDSALPSLEREDTPGQWQTTSRFTDVTAYGNALGLALPDFCHEEGLYRVNIPGNLYFLDGNPGQDIQLSYEIRSDAYGFDAFPPAGDVDEICGITVRIPGCTLTWQPSLSVYDMPALCLGDTRLMHFTDLSAQGETLTLSLATPFTTPGTYTVTIPYGSYLKDMQPGHEIQIEYTVMPAPCSLKVSPEEGPVPSLQFFTLTVVGAQSVEICAAPLITPADTPTLALETSPGIWTDLFSFTQASCHGHTFGFSIPDPVTTDGRYRLTVPAGFYTIDSGRPGIGADFYFEVAPASSAASAPETTPGAYIYDIRGHKIPASRQITPKLKGLYIVNGKKRILR